MEQGKRTAGYRIQRGHNAKPTPRSSDSLEIEIFSSALQGVIVVRLASSQVIPPSELVRQAAQIANEALRVFESDFQQRD